MKMLLIKNRDNNAIDKLVGSIHLWKESVKLKIGQ